MQVQRFTVFLSAIVLLASGLTAAEVIPHRQDRPPGPPLSPREAIAKMTVPDGFTVELVAAEPDIVNPVAMTFDERGRIWITESLEYPRRSPGKGRDRVKVLEDTNGDGRADKVTVFADGLNIPSGIAVGYGGVWVANAPDILFLQDTDGDGKADRQEVVVTGFGRADTHELPNSLTWGPDGWLYGLNGVFNGSHVKHQGKEHRFTCALFRIHPRTHAFELFAEGTSNPWGVAWDNEGSAFISACVIDHLWHITESGYYHRQGGPYPPHTWKIESIVNHKHQKAAYCGLHFFDSDAYPPQYRERLYMGNIHGGCINVDVLQRRGSTYFATGDPDFLTANDAWFMPVVQKTGPDGCLYILDWYDRYHCYQDANRDPEGIDRLKGRLYRVRYKNTPRATGFDLAKESDEQLIERLQNPNVYFRDIAQRLLSERNQAATRPKLEALALDEEAPRKARMHALWALAGTGEVDQTFHVKLLTHADSTLRAWGVRIAGNQRTVSQPILSHVVGLARDESPDVQLQVAVASRKINDFPAIPILLTVLAHSGEDKLLPHIVWQNLHPLIETQTDVFLTQLANWKPLGFPRMTEIMPRIVERILGRTDRDPAPVARLFALLADEPGANPQAAGQTLQVLAQRVQSREIAGDDLARLRMLMQPQLQTLIAAGPANPLYLDSAFLATTWKDAAGLDAVRNAFTQTDTPANRRLEALGALIAAGDDSLLAAVEQVLQDRKANSPELRGQVIASLGRLEQPRVADVLLAHYPQFEPELKPRVIELLTQRLAWSRRLLQAVGEKQVPADVLNLNQVRRLLALNNEALSEQIRATWGTIRDERNPQREQFIAEMKTLIRNTPGDPLAGEKAFKKACAQCHKIHGEGTDVGPDITLNGRNSFEQLLSNVFDPSLVIGAAYRAHIVVTIDGRVLTGLLAEDTPQRIVLKVQGGKLETIARGDIEVFKTSEISMMPEQLEKQLQPQEIADLFAFLTLDKHPSDPTARQLPGVREVIPRASNDPKQSGEILAEVAPGFSANAVGEGGVALLSEHLGRSAVVQTHPVKPGEPCVLRGTFTLPAEKKSRLQLAVSHHPQGDWQLLVKVNGQTLLETAVGPTTTVNGWAEHIVDLSRFAGEKVALELHNRPTGWHYEFGYWGRAAIVSEESVD